MLAVKAKHATMLLTVSDVEGLPEGLQDMDVDKSKKSSAQAVMVIEHNIPHSILIKLFAVLSMLFYNYATS